MAVDFKISETKDNLMRAFAGESQARNRYTFAAEFAQQKKLYVIRDVFCFTASQEEQHAKIYYNHLKSLTGETIHVDGGYPVDLQEDVMQLLLAAQHNEYEEHDSVYQTFANVAEQEGFLPVANSFRMIAEIEKTHGDRFGRLAEWMQQNKLFATENTIHWMCMKCGHIQEAKEAPLICPVCKHEQGHFIRLKDILLP